MLLKALRCNTQYNLFEILNPCEGLRNILFQPGFLSLIILFQESAFSGNKLK